MLSIPLNNSFINKFSICLLPTTFLLVSLVMREHAGPFWLWSNLDPDYAYLFDALNLVNYKWPQEMAHPGITVDFFGAIIIKIMHPLMPLEELNRVVLTHSESYLKIIGRVFIIVNALGLLILGFAGLLVFRDWVPSLLLQMGPFISKLAFKWSLHVSPEPLLITTAIALSILTVLALRTGQLEKFSSRYVIGFAAICGFGISTKLTSAGIYLLPVFLLGNWRAITHYLLASIIFIIFFSLPAVGSFHLVLDQVISISSATGHHGYGPSGFIDLINYPRNLIRVASRPAFFVVILFGIGLVVLIKVKYPRNYDSPTWRALSGLCLAFCCQAILVAKHPSGHYMIPALVMSSLGLVLIYDLLKISMCDSSRSRKNLRNSAKVLLVILCVSQGLALSKLDKQFLDRSYNATKKDETRYKNCAKIYVWPASNIQYGLFFGRWNTKGSFSREISSYFPDQSKMYMINDGKLHDLKGTINLKKLPGHYSCIYVRGERPKTSLKLLNPIFRKYPLKDTCKLGEETIITWGIECGSD